RYGEALAIHREALARRPDFNALSALATYHTERGEPVEAEGWFLAARRGYRGVSPFPLAVLEFQCGQTWLAQHAPSRARPWLESAVRRLPAYAPAQGHLAEVDAAEGRTTVAIGSLRRLALTSDDPDYAAQLARILSETQASAEAERWRAHA